MKRQLVITLMLIFSSAFSLSLFWGCDDDNPEGSSNESNDLKIAVFSDPHLYDTTLGTAGTDFQIYLAHDRKLIVESEALLQSVVNAIKNSDVDVVFIPGDLTKDGEKACHVLMASYLNSLELAGKKVFVVPGNHDINNQHGAKSYSESGSSSIATVTSAEFENIYSNYGFSEAFARDLNSLSYVTKLTDKIWLLGLDVCRYSENTADTNMTGGKISPASLEWIKSILHQGKTEGALVLGMMHHGLMEHYTTQTTMFEEYVIEDWQTLHKTFADSGMKVVFTGHFHSNDVVKGTGNEAGSFIFDVETGSTVTYPCPYRTLTLDADTLTIRTTHITNPNVNYGGVSFTDSASTYLEEGIYGLAFSLLTTEFGLSEADAQMPAQLLTDAFVAHYAGDELPDALTLATIQQIAQNPDQTYQFLANTLSELWTDDLPADNNLTIDLNTGNVLN